MLEDGSYGDFDPKKYTLSRKRNGAKEVLKHVPNYPGPNWMISFFPKVFEYRPL